jgi:hypothetical protein
MLVDNLLLSLVLGVASGVIVLTVTKSSIFAFIRVWVKSKSPFIGELISCPYCFSHWICFLIAIIYRKPIIQVIPVMDFIVTWLVMVFISSICAGIIFKLFSKD